MNIPEQRSIPSMVDGLSQRIETQANAAGHTLDGIAHQAADYAQRSSDAVQVRAEALRKQALQARELTEAYIQREPMRAMLYAAAAGAALVVLGKLLMRGPR
jgi:ElaB/YqjD/DUF883 family membrane-anchored ribosome-binding protein